MFRVSHLAAAVALATLTACVSDPATVESRSQRMDALDARAEPIYASYFQPLFSECVSGLQSGTPNMESLAAKGFADSAFGIHRKIGRDFLAKITYMLLPKQNRCIITAPSAGGTLEPLGDVMKDGMAALGYRYVGTGTTTALLVFEKGGQKVQLSAGRAQAVSIEFNLL